MKSPSFRVSPAIDAFWDAQPLAEPNSPATLVVLTPPLEAESEAAALVQNIVKACKLPEPETTVLSFAEVEWAPWYQFQKTLSPKLVLSMGVFPETLQLQVRFPPLQPVAFHESVWVLAPAPDELAANRELRERLWKECLKPFFGGGQG